MSLSEIKRQSRRRTQTVDYVALNGGLDDDAGPRISNVTSERAYDSDSDDSTELTKNSEQDRLQNSLKRRARLFGVEGVSSAKKPTVQVTIGTPSMGEFLQRADRIASQGIPGKPALIKTLNGRKQSLIVRTSGNSRDGQTTVSQLSGAGRPVVMRLPEGSRRLVAMPASKALSASSPVRKVVVRVPEGSSVPSPAQRGLLVRLPGGNFGFAEKPSMDASDNLMGIREDLDEEEDNPFKTEDEEFMNEVNKFLDTSMCLRSGKSSYIGSDFLESERSPVKDDSIFQRTPPPDYEPTEDPDFLGHAAIDPDLGRDCISCRMCGSQLGRKGFKLHAKSCRGIIVKWGPKRDTDDISEKPCPRCGAIFHRTRDFEVHMATEHNFFWRLAFEQEQDFKQWFVEEGLDESTIAGPSKSHDGVFEKVFYCAISGGQRMKVKCTCRVVVKKSVHGILVRYFPSHNHSQRVVRQQMSSECRELILSMLRLRMKNAEILKVIRGTYPESSVNQTISPLAISRLRCRYFRPDRDSNKPETRGRKPKKKKKTEEEGEAEGKEEVVGFEQEES